MTDRDKEADTRLATYGTLAPGRANHHHLAGGSAELPDHWPRLDAFEEEGYRRVVTPVQTADGALDAWIYVLAG